MKRGTMLVGAIVVLLTRRASSEPQCAATDVEYALTGTVRLTDTPYNLANGAHKVGPGSIVLRYEPAGRVTIRAYSMRQAFTIVVSAFFSQITIVANTTTHATPDACGIVAEGVRKGSTIEWLTHVRSVLTEGTLHCSGKYCGSFGAPVPGTSKVRIGPANMRVRLFELASDGRTFTMPFTFGTKTESPKQTSFLALTGREVKRTCVPSAPRCSR
jgi:hypothetical protein